LLDIGDFIGVAGTLFRTRTGELTILAKELPSWRRASSRFQRSGMD